MENICICGKLIANKKQAYCFNCQFDDKVRNMAQVDLYKLVQQQEFNKARKLVNKQFLGNN